ncbi:MAG TPA: LuxR C-terminal-related transcriptional regulator, partial [Thermomicrobiales bacterium]|nr:LuxR C-terminal-related transcriptional regulator [Thermomicrobiales bacterium]
FAAAWARGRDTPPAELLNVGRVLTEAEPDHASGARRGAAALAPGPALTAREREVLQLVVEGRTDREIGQILFIGHRTVASHVGNILGKLGVDSRTAAATQAVRRGLV